MKRMIQVIVIAFFITLAFPTAAFASQVYTEGYFEYQVEDDSVTICGYFGHESEVTVPSMIAGNPVSKIAKGSFDDNTTVKTVNLPDTIMNIEEGAFAQGISVIYDSNTDEPIESGSTDNPSDSNETEDTPGNTEKPGNTPTEGNEIGVEEVEVNLNEADAVTGIPVANTGKVVTVNAKNQLVMIETDGTETVLDDSQKYNLAENADGTVTITDEDGAEIEFDEEGNPVIPSAQNELGENEVRTKIKVRRLVIAAVIVIIVIAAILFLWKWKKLRWKK